MKEPSRPTTSVGYLFRIAPIDRDPHRRRRPSRSSRSATCSDIFGKPVGLYGIDVTIGPLYVFALAGISFYGIMLGGWASGSKYSFLGAMRGAAQLISYEVSQGLSLVGVVMTAGTLSLDRDRPRTGGHVVHRPAVRRLPHLHGRLVRRDQPRAVRPRRGRRRAGRRVLHRVRRHAVRRLPVRGVHEHDRRVGHRHDDVPRWLAAALRDSHTRLGPPARRASPR